MRVLARPPRRSTRIAARYASSAATPSGDPTSRIGCRPRSRRARLSCSVRRRPHRITDGTVLRSDSTTSRRSPDSLVDPLHLCGPMVDPLVVYRHSTVCESRVAPVPAVPRSEEPSSAQGNPHVERSPDRIEIDGQVCITVRTPKSPRAPRSWAKRSAPRSHKAIAFVDVGDGEPEPGAVTTARRICSHTPESDHVQPPESPVMRAGAAGDGRTVRPESG